MFYIIFLSASCLVLLDSVIPASAAAATNNASPAGSLKEVSHEDLRDALLSLIHMFRDNTEKLEKHESRERQLGEQLKKSLQTLERKQKSEENSSPRLQEALNSIEARLAQLETQILKIEHNGNTHQILSDKLENVANMIVKFTATAERLETIVSSKIEAIVLTVQQEQSRLSTLEEKLVNLDTQKLQEQISNLIQKVDTVSLANGVECQGISDSLMKIDASKKEILEANEKSLLGLRDFIDKYHRILNEGQQSLFTAFSDPRHINNNSDLLNEIKSISKLEQVLIQTAENVLDTKRRIEYGTHQILLEVGDLVKTSAKQTDETTNRRFDIISSEILDNQNGALKNLSTKLETEISQVWRQIGIMYQTLTNSADSLDKLQQQTEIYINGSLNTMDNMEGKVGQITSRMSEVDENLNYLLGRLSLVTQEFNQIKTGLGEALDNIRSSFHTVQDKVKDVGPGPNPIPQEELPQVPPKQRRYIRH